MNDYFIRCKQSDIPQLHALAVALGVLTTHLDQDGQPTGEYGIAPGRTGAWAVVGTIFRPTGEVIYGEPFEQPVMKEVLTKVPSEFDPEVMVDVTTWEPTGETETVTPETKVTAPVLDEDGDPYWHANLRIDIDLAEQAKKLAPEIPAIAAGLSDLARWFVVGEDGRASMPKEPAQVWL
jgi:hypothetical protein